MPLYQDSKAAIFFKYWSWWGFSSALARQINAKTRRDVQRHRDSAMARGRE